MDSGASSTPSSFAMLDAERLKVYHFPNEHPVDDVARTTLLLRRRSKYTDHLFLRLFLEDATVTLRQELCHLPEHLRATLPPFENILDLANVPELRKLPLGILIESLMVLVIQLGLIIG
jgi:monodictyphenone polyketide synthase